MRIISLDEAKAKGFKKFFSGIPCRRGHICERYVSGYSCVECTKLPARKAKIKAYDREHKTERDEYIRKWKEQNRARVNELGCIWAKRHPETHAMRARLRRARQRKALGSHTVKEVLELLVKQQYKCVYCCSSLKEKYEVDHIIPISKGGSNYITNIQCLCVSCNRRKNAKDPALWAIECEKRSAR